MQKHSTTSVACVVVILASSLAVSREALAAEQFRIVPGESELRVLVFRSGSLARLAHNHVISSTALSGTLTAGDTAAGSSLDIHLPVDSLVVDDARVRAEEGRAFSAEVSEKDVHGTRRNMLGPRLLQAGEFDSIRVSSTSISGDFPDLKIEADIMIRGARHVVELPAIVERYDDRIVATGSADVAHSELGLSPFTAALGTMRVGDQMTFKYRVVATKIASGPPATEQSAAGARAGDLR
ncbi:MAG TPA: YceI family protein [Woeseiaceae bacterium]